MKNRILRAKQVTEAIGLSRTHHVVAARPRRPVPEAGEARTDRYRLGVAPKSKSGLTRGPKPPPSSPNRGGTNEDSRNRTPFAGGGKNALTEATDAVQGHADARGLLVGDPDRERSGRARLGSTCPRPPGANRKCYAGRAGGQALFAREGMSEGACGQAHEKLFAYTGTDDLAVSLAAKLDHRRDGLGRLDGHRAGRLDQRPVR